MKRSRTLIAVASLCALFTAGYVAYFRDPEPKPTGVGAEIQKFDEELAPARGRLRIVQEQLDQIQKQEREVCARLAGETKRLNSEDRAALEVDLKNGALSETNAERFEFVSVFTQYKEALNLKKEAAALHEWLSKYKLEISRALLERDRLQRRLELSESLGYDPDSDASELAPGNEILDRLTALTDVSEDEAFGSATLLPEDVANADSKVRDALLEEIATEVDFHDVKNGTVGDYKDDEAITLTLDQRLAEYSTQDVKRNPERKNLSKRLYLITCSVILLATWYWRIVVLTFCALGKGGVIVWGRLGRGFVGAFRGLGKCFSFTFCGLGKGFAFIFRGLGKGFACFLGWVGSGFVGAFRGLGKCFSFVFRGLGKTFAGAKPSMGKGVVAAPAMLWRGFVVVVCGLWKGLIALPRTAERLCERIEALFQWVGDMLDSALKLLVYLIAIAFVGFLLCCFVYAIVVNLFH